jgi:hypothetical protein
MNGRNTPEGLATLPKSSRYRRQMSNSTLILGVPTSLGPYPTEVKMLLKVKKPGEIRKIYVLANPLGHFRRTGRGKPSRSARPQH